MMGGTICVDSEYGKGSTFTVAVQQKAVECGAIGAEVAESLRGFTFTGARQSASQKISREPMPYGSVLVVDDVEVNLMVAAGFLEDYELKVSTASGGSEAVGKVKSGESYDIIFMDHLMPDMDGMEATAALRALGYGGVIIALTANAIVGNEELFTRNGFDGFLSKPIDIQKLDAALNRFIRDRHPDEAAKLKAEASAGKVKAVKLNARFLEALKRDAAKAASALREALANGDEKMLSTAAHGMKSAFAAIGEDEISRQALALELAARNGDKSFITANTENFIETLEVYVKNAVAN
jgi:CheY-like chemotaxis protein